MTILLLTLNSGVLLETFSSLFWHFPQHSSSGTRGPNVGHSGALLSTSKTDLRHLRGAIRGWATLPSQFDAHHRSARRASFDHCLDRRMRLRIGCQHFCLSGVIFAKRHHDFVCYNSCGRQLINSDHHNFRCAFARSGAYTNSYTRSNSSSKRERGVSNQSHGNRRMGAQQFSRGGWSDSLWLLRD